MGTKRERNDKIRHCKELREIFGEVLYLSKVRKSNNPTWEYEFKKELNNLEKTLRPEPGDIITWENNDSFDRIIHYTKVFSGSETIKSLRTPYDKPRAGEFYDSTNITINFYRKKRILHPVSLLNL